MKFPAGAAFAQCLDGDGGDSEATESSDRDGLETPHGWPAGPALGMASKIEFHPLSELLPLPTDEEIDELAADIKSGKQHQPIVLLDRKILEGRCRYLACQKAGVKPFTRDYNRREDGNDPVAFVLSQNVFRRHLTASQRAMSLAALRAKQPPQKKSVNLQTTNGGSTASANLRGSEAAAVAAGVSAKTMESAERVAANAPKQIIDAVRDGDVAVSDAAAIADLPKSEQKQALAKVESGEAKTLKAAAKREHPPKSGKQKADPRGWGRWEDCYGKLKRATDDLNKEFRGEKFCRDMHRALNECYDILKSWKQALR